MKRLDGITKDELESYDTRYLLYLPEDYETDKAKEWPLILFMHGMGERGDDLEALKRHGMPKLVAAGKHFPFIIVSPQCPDTRRWDGHEMVILLNKIAAEHRVDLDRVYCTGLSMGGFGTWKLAQEYPDRFAAIAPICGGGDSEDVERIKNIPTWVFHGAKDTTVSLERSRSMVDALRKLGGDPRLTIYPNAGHDSWTETYNNPELYEWFLKHKLSDREIRGTRCG